MSLTSTCARWADCSAESARCRSRLTASVSSRCSSAACCDKSAAESARCRSRLSASVSSRCSSAACCDKSARRLSRSSASVNSRNSDADCCVKSARRLSRSKASDISRSSDVASTNCFDSSRSLGDSDIDPVNRTFNPSCLPPGDRQPFLNVGDLGESTVSRSSRNRGVQSMDDSGPSLASTAVSGLLRSS